MNAIETAPPISPFDYGDAVRFQVESGEARVGSIVGFDNSDLNGQKIYYALIEVRDGEILQVPLSDMTKV